MGSSETKHPAKILLEHLDPGGQHLDCYRLYLKTTVSFNVAHRCVSLLSPKMLSKFYLETEPLKAPKYFDFFDDQNLSKLENALQKRLVVLMRGCGTDTWDKVHDKRVYDLLKVRCGGASDNTAAAAAAAAAAAVDPNATSWQVLYFVVEHNDASFWELYELTSPRDIRTYGQLLSEESFYDPKTMRMPLVLGKGNRSSSSSSISVFCLHQALTQVLGVTRGQRQLDQHQHSPACLSLRELVFAKSKNDVAREVGVEFVLASHLRCKPLTRARTRKLPINNVFGVHAVYAFSEGSLGIEAMPVVCVTHNLRFYRLLEPYATSVRLGQTRRRHPKHESFPGSAQGLKLKSLKELTGREEGGGGGPYVHHHQVDTCPCTGCKNAKDFEHNMSPDGPQRPFKTDLSSFDLFRLLGKFSPKVEADLLNVCRLSVASFDVESVATPLADQVGNEDLNFEPETLSDRRLPRQVQAVHLPCRIGFSDQLRMDTDRPTLIFRYDPENPDQMVADFIEAIFEHRDAATTIKYGVLHPYFEWLERYKRAHFEFYQRKGWLPLDYCDRWQNFRPVLSWDDEEDQGGSDDDDDDNDDGDDDEQELDRLAEEAVSELAAADVGPRAGEAFNPHRPSRPGSPQLEDDQELTAEQLLGREAATNARVKRDARRIYNIEKSWEFSVWGLLEKRLRGLAHGYTVYGFNRYQNYSTLQCSWGTVQYLV